MNDNLPAGETILEQLNWRYAVKTFDAGKKVSERDWETLEQALILAPSSFGLQPYKFVVVTDPKLKEKLRPAAWNQSQITDCSHLVVFAAKKTLTEADVDHYLERVVEVRGVPRETLSDYDKMMKGFQKTAHEQGWSGAWTARQAYIPLGFLLETAALLGIDACPMEGFEPAKFDEILDLGDHTATAICCIGYRDEENDWLAKMPKVRFPKNELIERR